MISHAGAARAVVVAAQPPTLHAALALSTVWQGEWIVKISYFRFWSNYVHFFFKNFVPVETYQGLLLYRFWTHKNSEYIFSIIPSTKIMNYELLV